MNAEDAGPGWFERVWEDREERVYPRLFGPVSRGIYVPSPKLFTETFGQETYDPRWLHSGVFEFAPTAERPSWLYVTSGMSNAWEDDQPRADGPSGFGHEFVFESSQQGMWAVDRLIHLMVFQTLIEHGIYPDRSELAPFDRVPLRCPITPEPSEVCWLMLGLPGESYPSRFALDSGWVDLIAVVGLTDAEAAFARREGGEALLERLRSAGAYPVTDPTRTSVVAGPDE